MRTGATRRQRARSVRWFSYDLWSMRHPVQRSHRRHCAVKEDKRTRAGASGRRRAGPGPRIEPGGGMPNPSPHKARMARKRKRKPGTLLDLQQLLWKA